QAEPIQLVAGGAGIVPLMAMIRSRVAMRSSAAPFRLFYSVRNPDSGWYRDELQGLSADRIRGTFSFTPTAPLNWASPPRRIDATVVTEASLSSTLSPTCYVCGPTSFVERAAALLTGLGHSPDRIRTERFGPTGDQHRH